MTQEMKDFQKDLRGRDKEYLIKMILAMVDKDSPSFEDDSVKKMFTNQQKIINDYHEMVLDLKSGLKDMIGLNKKLTTANEELGVLLQNISNPHLNLN